MAKDAGVMNARGIFTHQNDLSQVPDGAMLEADNVVIDREGIAETRRGVSQDSDDNPLFNPFGSYPRRFYSFKDRIYVNDDNDLILHTHPDQWVVQDSIAPPDVADTQAGFRVMSAQSNRNIYFTSDEGIRKIEDPSTGNSVDAGMFKGLGGTAIVSGTTGFMTNDTAIAYRIVWGIKDFNDNLILGAPSSRIIAVNSSGDFRDVDLTFTIPDGITENHIYQIYRSNESASASTTPNDELQLVYENNPTSGEIIALSVSFTDNLPNDLKRATLYTSPSQQGISQANEQPPFAKDMDVYKNHMFFGNTRQKNRIFLTLIAVSDGGSPAGDGFRVGDTVNLAGEVYTGVASSPGNAQFVVDETGTPSENIDATARNLVNAINVNTNNSLVYAYYTSGFEDLPGQMLYEERGVGGATFGVASSRGEAFDPILTSDPADRQSDNDEKKNRIFFSKEGQPEAVPLINFVDVGTAEEPIQRVLALRESLFIIKPDGIFRLVGETSANFRVLLSDNTTTLRAAMSAVVHNNSVFMMSDQGVVSIGENGDIAIMSRPIEKTLLETTTFTDFETETFGISYESDRKYILYTLEAEGDIHPTIAWVYNMLTQSWTKWNFKPEDRTGDLWITGGFVDDNDDLLYLGGQIENATQVTDAFRVYQENKAFTRFDSSDFDYETYIASYSVLPNPDGTLYTTMDFNDLLDAGDSNNLLGWTLYQAATGLEVVIDTLSSNGAATSVIFQGDIGTWSTNPLDTVSLYKPINSVVEYVPNHSGNPLINKHWKDCRLVFDNAQFETVNVQFTSDYSASGAGDDVPSVQGDGQQVIRTLVPRDYARCHWIRLKVTSDQALTRFGLSGYSLSYEPVGQRQQGSRD